MAIRASHIFSSLLLACAAGSAHAVELGDAQVLSHIGQPLAASVELTLIDDARTRVEARLAHPDVYRGANIVMPAALSGLNLKVTARDGRQFLHLSTSKPVENRHLHVYLELIDGGQRTVRLVTLWLTQDPNPAPALAPKSAPVPLAAPVPVVDLRVVEAPAAKAPEAKAPPARVDAPRRSAPPRTPVAAAAPAAALQEGEEYVEEGARRTPAAAPLRKAVARSAAPPPAKAPARTVAPASAPVPAAPPAPQEAPGTCAPQPAAGHLNACVALGEKNAALRHELGQLEAKVKGLQAAGGAALAGPAPAAAPAQAPAPKGAPRIQLKAKKPAPPEAGMPWGLIGGVVVALLALAGLVAALLRRRKRSSFGKIPKEHKPAKLPTAVNAAEPDAPDAPPKPHFMAAVKARLMPGSGKNPAPVPVEPAPDKVET